jgi:hypothetical protein
LCSWVLYQRQSLCSIEEERSL